MRQPGRRRPRFHARAGDEVPSDAPDAVIPPAGGTQAGDADWLWVLERACPDCGFDPSALVPARVPAILRENTHRWRAVLGRPEPEHPPDGSPGVWSPLEYACHVRDVHRLFTGRLDSMLSTDHPVFPGWDQEAAAVQGDYGAQDPVGVCTALAEATGRAAELITGISGDQWARGGTRADGAEFTVATLTAYYVHEVTHHLWDVDPACEAVEPEPS